MQFQLYYIRGNKEFRQAVELDDLVAAEDLLEEYFYNGIYADEAAIMEIIPYDNGKVTYSLKNRERKIIYQLTTFLK